MCRYLNGHELLISWLLTLRNYAALGNKEFVFVLFVWKQTGIMQRMAQLHQQKIK